MKGFHIVLLYVLSFKVLSMECSDKLISKITQSLNDDETIQKISFKKVLAPKELFVATDLGQKVIMNRYKYPVYYFQSLIDSRSMGNTSYHIYLLSPNTCKIMKKATLFKIVSN